MVRVVDSDGEGTPLQATYTMQDVLEIKRRSADFDTLRRVLMSTRSEMFEKYPFLGDIDLVIDYETISKLLVGYIDVKEKYKDGLVSPGIIDPNISSIVELGDVVEQNGPTVSIKSSQASFAINEETGLVEPVLLLKVNRHSRNFFFTQRHLSEYFSPEGEFLIGE